MKFANLLLIVFILVNFLIGQPRIFPRGDRGQDFHFNEQIIYSYWINPVQFDENFIFNYRIRYDFLLFEKTPSNKTIADTFQAKIKVMLEISSPDLLIPIRTVEEVVIKTDDFEKTTSKNTYYTSNFSLKLPPKKVKATLTIFDLIRNKEFTLKPIEVDLDYEKSFELIFIKKDDLKNISSQDLKNKFYNFLPFSPEKFYLLLPDRDEFNKIRIEDKFTGYFVERIQNTGLRYSIYELDTLDLIEGNYELKWDNKKENLKSLNVIWLDKPDYLKDFDNAVKILNYLFENDKSLDRYFTDKNEQRRKFFEIWKKLDPTPSTPFNELMAEFYRRADYASFEFKTVSQNDGAQTDRGKIYIIYGPPSKIDRTFTSDGRSVEIWTYNSLRNIKFTFIDENKNGIFVLQK